MDSQTLVSSSATISRRLNAPPRALDGAQTLALMTNRTGLMLGAAFGLLVSLLFSPTLRRDGVVAQLLPHHGADAVVESVEQVTRSSKSHRWPEWEVTARVVDRPDVSAFGSLRSAVVVGDRVHALVPDARPDLALAWKDGRPPSLVNFWFCAFVVALGVGATVVGLVRNRRDVLLLRDGLLTTGRIVDRTSRTVKGGTMWHLTFRYATARSGEQTTRVTVAARDVDRLVDDEGEFLVYDPARPERALLLDALPDYVRVAGDGNLTPVPWSRGLLRSLALVAAVVLLVVLLAVLQVFG